MREEWKCAWTMSGEQYVMTHGAPVMLMLPARNLDSLIQVNIATINYHVVTCVKNKALSCIGNGRYREAHDQEVR